MAWPKKKRKRPISRLNPRKRAAPRGPRKQPRFRATDVVQILTADNTTRIVGAMFAHRQAMRRKGGIARFAKGDTRGNFTSESSRAALAKRWAKKPMTRLGYRKGQRFRNRPQVKRAPLRELYALNPVRGVQYAPSLKVWTVTDEFGTRTISELTALRRLGHLPRATDAVVPETIVKKVWGKT